jgi:Protein of unknown function (DUF2911)
MRRLPIVVSIALAACRPTSPAEQYGFLALLGNDTVSVERVTRSPRRLDVSGVDRFPLVTERHTVIELADDGRLTRMVMDVHTPIGATPAARHRRIIADFTADSVKIAIEDSLGTTRRDFRTNGALTVPHISMMYSIIELEMASAMRRGMKPGDSVPFRQFYPDRDIGPSFVLHSGWVQRRGGDSVVLRHDWLSGVGDATVDTAGRLLAYSGMRSTYKVAVRRLATPPDVAPVLTSLVTAEQRTGARQLSVRDTARGSIGAATMRVDYGRPLARGRVLLGSVIAYDRVWRTGANAATQFTTSAPITLAGIALAAGTYTLWTVPRADGSAELIVNGESGQWGTEYSAARDVGTARLQVAAADPPAEQFTVAIVPTGPRRGSLSLAWGTFRWTAPILVR